MRSPVRGTTRQAAVRQRSGKRFSVIDDTMNALGGAGTQRVLDLARRHLGMDLAFIAEFTDDKQVYRGFAGDATSFGWELHDGPPLATGYCRRMIAGELPNAVPDSSLDPVARALPVTAQAGIGSYVGVPVYLTDGSLYGSLCTVSHGNHDVDDKDARFLTLLAELVSEEVQEERRRAASQTRVRELLDNQSIQIALQPIVEIHTGRMLGAEALSRFPRDHGPPDEVFATGHAVGLGSELERLAARHAFDTLPMLGAETYLAINLTPVVAMELATVALGLPELPLDRLVLEITEHSAVDNYELLRDSLAAARKRGLRLAIDDTGAGYASLHHVVQLHPDIIKIDRSLVDGNADNPALRSVIRAFTALACDLGATVVAEGVEKEVDLDSARELGVHAAQGYLLARPSTEVEDVRRWLAGGLAV
jgi:EAL domain-containing protein (putative c-di-GMP-specific phosphodiesterase class I)